MLEASTCVQLVQLDKKGRKLREGQLVCSLEATARTATTFMAAATLAATTAETTAYHYADPAYSLGGSKLVIHIFDPTF